MERTVSASEANRKFSWLLQGIREGHSYVVTRHGKPVAKIAPFEKNEEARTRAWEILFGRLRSQPVVNGSRWTRDELYEDEQP
jgi:prevent-host-death family protein